MNLKILDSWLREYLKTEVLPKRLQELLSLSGPSIERVVPQGEDFVYEIEITNNRIDLASVFGLAREAATILKHQGEVAELKPLPLVELPSNLPALSLKIEDPEKLAKRFLAVALEVSVVSKSPDWLKERLLAAGIRSLNYLIDVTNYVMLEVGHPLHVFDLDRLNSQRITFRKAKKGETLITLDGVKRELSGEDVVIVDDSDNIVDLPSIMGCINSVVKPTTKRVLLFTEVIDPSLIRRTSMRLALRTLAASYNENSPDSQAALLAVKRGITLYLQSGIRLSSLIFDSKNESRKLPTVTLSLSDLESYMNVKLDPAVVVAILDGLGIHLVSKSGGMLVFEIPTFREKDIQIKEDLIEEVARIYGYAKIPTIMPPFEFISDPFIRERENSYRVENRVRELLAALGYSELYNYSMISEAENKLFGLPESSIKMINPMSQELVYFRQSLLPSLVKNALINQGSSHLAIFEMANVYLPRPNSLPLEQPNLAVLLKGEYGVLKGVVEAVFSSGFIQPTFIHQAKKEYFSQTESSAIMIAKEQVGVIGRVLPKLLHQLGLKSEYVAVELDLSLLQKYYRLQVSIPPVNSQSEIIEDLTYETGPTVNWQVISGELLTHFKEIVHIDYVNSFQKFVTMRLYSQPASRKSILDKVYQHLETKYGLKIKRPKADSSK